MKKLKLGKNETSLRQKAGLIYMYLTEINTRNLCIHVMFLS